MSTPFPFPPLGPSGFPRGGEAPEGLTPHQFILGDIGVQKRLAIAFRAMQDIARGVDPDTEVAIFDPKGGDTTLTTLGHLAYGPRKETMTTIATLLSRSEAHSRYPLDHIVSDPFGETGEAHSDPYGDNETLIQRFLSGVELVESGGHVTDDAVAKIVGRAPGDPNDYLYEPERQAIRDGASWAASVQRGAPEMWQSVRSHVEREVSRRHERAERSGVPTFQDEDSAFFDGFIAALELIDVLDE